MNLKRVHFGIIQFSNKHTEIFGTFIEILKKYNWPITIYYNLESDEYTFLKYYEKIFGKLDICPITEINYDLDLFIIVSSSDYKNNTSTIEQIAHKSIFIHHQKIHHRPFMKKTITVSPVIQTAEMPINEYILPIYRNYKNIHYKSSYSSSKTVFAVVGGIRIHANGVPTDRDLTQLRNFIEAHPNDNYEFWFFMRKWDWIGISKRHKFLANNPKIIGFAGLTTEQMIKHLHHVKFILPLSKKGGWFYNQRLTGAIPIAINFNIPLVIEEKLATIYGLENCSFCYQDTLEPLISLITISKDDYYSKILELVKYKKRITKQNEINFVNLCVKPA
jgi:hypothetical protein